MTQQKPISHFIAGLIVAAAIIVYSIILNFMGITSGAAIWISYIILAVGIIIFITMYGKAMNHQVTFGNLFAYGFKTTAIITLVFIAFLIVFNLAFPEFKEKALEAAEKSMQEEGKLSQSDINEGIATTRKFFWVFLIGASMLFFLVLGVISSLIGAGITRKDKINPMDQLSI